MGECKTLGCNTSHKLTNSLQHWGHPMAFPRFTPGPSCILWRAWRVEVCGSKICRFSVCNSPSATLLIRRTAGWVVSCVDRKDVERSHLGVEHFQGIFECSHFPPLLNRPILPLQMHTVLLSWYHMVQASLSQVHGSVAGAAGAAIKLFRTSVCRAGAAHCPTQG